MTVTLQPRDRKNRWVHSLLTLRGTPLISILLRHQFVKPPSLGEERQTHFMKSRLMCHGNVGPHAAMGRTLGRVLLRSSFMAATTFRACRPHLALSEIVTMSFEMMLHPKVCDRAEVNISSNMCLQMFSIIGPSRVLLILIRGRLKLCRVMA